MPENLLIMDGYSANEGEGYFKKDPPVSAAVLRWLVQLNVDFIALFGSQLGQRCQGVDEVDL